MNNLLSYSGIAGSLINPSIRHNVKAGVEMHFTIQKMKFAEGWQIFTDSNYPPFHAYIKDLKALLEIIIPSGIIKIAKNASGHPVKNIKQLNG